MNDRDGLTDMSLLHYCCKAGAPGIGRCVPQPQAAAPSESQSLLSVLRCVFMPSPLGIVGQQFAYFATLPPPPRCLGDAQAAANFARQLLALGADPHLRSRWTDMRALHYAAYFDVPQLIQVVLQASRPGGERVPSAGVVSLCRGRARTRRSFCSETARSPR